MLSSGCWTKISGGGWIGPTNVEAYEGMNEADSFLERRYRRRIVGCGVFAFVVTFAIAAAIAVPNVQDELSDRVEEALAAGGVTGVDASFSGQDGTLRCGQPVSDPAALRELADRVDGVRRVELDATCAIAMPDDDSVDDVADGTEIETEESFPTTPTTSSDIESVPDTDPDPQAVAESVLDIVDRDPLFDTLAALLEPAGLREVDGLDGPGPFTVLAPTDAAFDAAFDDLGADTYQALVDDPERLGELLRHHVSVTELPTTGLSSGSFEMLDGREIVVSIDRGTEPTDVEFANGRTVAGVDDPRTQLDIAASNGVIHAIDRLLVPPGFDLDAEQAQPTIDAEPREVADASSAQDLEQELNALVAASPVRFEPGSAVLTPESNAVVAELAELVLRLDGISLEVVGHTDSDGGAPPNQRLSEDRANTVRLALVLLGLDPDQITARGAGETEPIIIDGVEDAEASRRVEFLVNVTQP